MTEPGHEKSVASTQEKLLRAAEEIVVEEGVHALSVRHIATRADVNSALIRYHFDNVDGLLMHLARLNAAQIAGQRDALLDALEERAEPDFTAAVDALVLPLWAPAAHGPDQRAIVVLDEVFSRAGASLQRDVWAQFAQGVERCTRALQRCLGPLDEEALAWRMRFVTAAALDVPPRASRVEARAQGDVYGSEGLRERLDHFRRFARQALREIG